MKKLSLLFLVLIILFSLNGCKKENNISTKRIKKITIENILGSWTINSGYDASSMEFQKEGNELLFYSYSGSKPWDNGTFILEKGKLTIKTSNGENIYDVSINEKTMKLTDTKGNIIVMTRPPKIIPKNEIELTVFNNYLAHIETLAGIESYRPEKKEFQWNVNENRTIKINGLSSHCKLEVSKDAQDINITLRSIGDYFEGLGFKQNAYNSSEIMDAYFSNKEIITIKKEDSSNIIINYGKMP